MASSVGGSNAAGRSPSATGTSEDGDTHVSPTTIGGDGSGGRSGRAAAGRGRRQQPRGRRLHQQHQQQRRDDEDDDEDARAADDADDVPMTTAPTRSSPRLVAMATAAGTINGADGGRLLENDYDATRTEEGTMDERDLDAYNASIENPQDATVIGEEVTADGGATGGGRATGALSGPAHSIQNSQAAETARGRRDSVTEGGENVLAARTTMLTDTAAMVIDADARAPERNRSGAGVGLTRSRVGGRGGATGSSSTVHGGPQRPANSAADSNTAAVSSEREIRAADSTEAQRLTTSLGEVEVGMTDTGPANSEEVEGGDIKAAASLLAADGVAAGGGVEVESKQLIMPGPTQWDNQEPWDVPRDELLMASLALKARADAFKALENFGTAERAYGHALRFIDQIEMFDTDEASDTKEMSSKLKTECLLEASACAIRRSDPVRAGELAARVLSRDPTNMMALRARALAAAATGDFGTAVHDLEEAIKASPNDPMLVAELTELKHRRDIARHMHRRSGISSSFIGAPGVVSWGTMAMNVMGGAASSAHGGQLFSYPNAGYVASGGLGMTNEVEGETDGAVGGIGNAGYGSHLGAYQHVGDNAAIDTRALLDGTHLKRPDSPSHATGMESNLHEPGTFNRVGGTPSVSKGGTVSMQKNAVQSDALQLGDESEEEGEEVCGGANKAQGT